MFKFANVNVYPVMRKNIETDARELVTDENGQVLVDARINMRGVSRNLHGVLPMAQINTFQLKEDKNGRLYVRGDASFSKLLKTPAESQELVNHRESDGTMSFHTEVAVWPADLQFVEERKNAEGKWERFDFKPEAVTAAEEMPF